MADKKKTPESRTTDSSGWKLSSRRERRAELRDGGTPEIEDGAYAGAAAESSPGSASGITQRSAHPMRKAGTLPDMRGYEDLPARDGSTNDDDGGSTGSRSVAARGVHPDSSAPDTASLSTRPPEDEASRRAAERDDAAAAKPTMARILQVMVAVFFPVMLLGGAIRAVTTPLFLWAEYNRPGFPADSYGFSTEDRMTYGSYTVDYILNWAPPRYLGELVGTQGGQLFLDSEVGHMADVKAVLGTSFTVAAAMAVLSIIACVYLARRYPGGVRRALFSGAVVTLALMVVLILAATLAWDTFFTLVHTVFFANGTWTFRLDDTLIRLFPAQFWMDSAIVVASLVVMVTTLTLALTWPTKARREKSLQAEAARRQRLRQSLEA